MARSVFVPVLTLGLALLVGCAPAPEPTAPAAPLPSMQLKFASAIAEGDIGSQAIRAWGDLVTQRTGGRITFQYFWAASLLKISELFDGVRDGRADAGVPATSYVSGKIPDVALLEVPFAYPTDEENILKFMDEVNPIIDGIYQKFGQKLLWSNPGITPDPVTCKDRFLDTPAAWKGALVRTAGRWQGETMKAWGANPTVIDLGDLYASLQRGTVDCTLLVYNLLDSFRIYEVAKNITRIDHSINYQTITMNLDVWNKLPKSDQEIMVKAGQDARKKALELRKDAVVKAIEKFKAQGVKVCTPSKEELTRLRAATRQVWDQIAKEVGEPGKKIMEIAARYQDRVAPGPTEGDLTSCSPAGGGY